MKKLPKFMPLIIFIFLTFFFLKKIIYFEESKDLKSVLIDKPFPAINLRSLDGNEEISEYIGKDFIIVNYVASWCEPCRVEHKSLKSIKNINTLIGIAYKDEKKNIQNFLNELGNPYKKVFLDTNGRSGIELGLYGVPETYFIDREGIIKYKHVGPIDERSLKGIINMLKKN